MAFLSCRSLVLLTTNYSDSGDKRGGAPLAPPQTLPSFKDVAVTQISPGSLFFIVILFLFVVFNRIKSKMEPKHMQAQKIRGGAEEGGRQVLTEQLLPLRYCLDSLPGLNARTHCPEWLPNWSNDCSSTQYHLLHLSFALFDAGTALLIRINLCQF